MTFDDYSKVTVGTDCIILSTDTHKEDNPHKTGKRGVQVLLIKRTRPPYKDLWSIPGGLVEYTKTIEETINGKIEKKVNLVGFYKEQLYTYGETARDPRGRVISVAYIGLVSKDKTKGVHDTGYGEPRWFWAMLDSKGNLHVTDTETNEEITEMAFDHMDILRDSLLRLRNKAAYTRVVYQMMPEKFTMLELQNVFEEIIGKTIYSFRRFVGKAVCETGEYAEQRAHRPAMLYRYNEELEEGIQND